MVGGSGKYDHEWWVITHLRPLSRLIKFCYLGEKFHLNLGIGKFQESHSFGYVIAFYIIMVLCLIILSLIPIFFLRKAQKKYHKNTYALQRKLYQAVLMQLYVAIFVGGSVLIVGPLIVMFKIKNTSIVIQLLICIFSIHGPLDLFIIGFDHFEKIFLKHLFRFFIPNHRKFFAKIIRKLCHKNNHNESVIVLPSSLK
jgi:hypothetical protein